MEIKNARDFEEESEPPKPETKYSNDDLFRKLENMYETMSEQIAAQNSEIEVLCLFMRHENIIVLYTHCSVFSEIE